MAHDDLDIPEGLSPKGRAAADAILAKMRADGRANAGGCKVFYSPAEWAARGEDYGLESVLIVCHDGGEHAAYFNMDYLEYNLMEQMVQALNAAGVWVEQCTSWYSAVYLN